MGLTNKMGPGYERHSLPKERYSQVFSPDPIRIDRTCLAVA